MNHRKRNNKGTTARLYLRGKDHADAVYKNSEGWAYITGMYYEGDIETILPDLNLPELDVDLSDDIEIPELDIDLPEIDKPIINKNPDVNLDTGFVFKMYPRLSILCESFSRSNTGVGHSPGVLYVDDKYIMEGQIPDKGLIAVDKYVVAFSSGIGSYRASLHITKDGYEWFNHDVTTSLDVVSSSYTLLKMGEARVAIANLRYSNMQIIYFNIIEEGDKIRLIEESYHHNFTGVDMSNGLYDVGYSYSGSLLFGYEPSDKRLYLKNYKLFEIRPSGVYEKSEFETPLILDQPGRDCGYTSDGTVYVSYKHSRIIKCGNTYVFATHRIIPIGATPPYRYWGTIAIHKSSNLIDWSYEELESNYETTTKFVPFIDIIIRGDVIYVYTIKYLPGNEWCATGYYSTGGQHWNLIPFGDTCSFLEYKQNDINSPTSRSIILNSKAESKNPSSVLNYRLLFDSNHYNIFPHTNYTPNSSTKNFTLHQYNNISFEYGKTKESPYLGILSYQSKIFINPMFQSSDNNFAILDNTEGSREDSGYLVQFVEKGDYCVQ